MCVKHTHKGSQVQASHTCSSVRDDASSAVLPFINTNSPLFVSRLRWWRLRHDRLLLLNRPTHPPKRCLQERRRRPAPPHLQWQQWIGDDVGGHIVQEQPRGQLEAIHGGAHVQVAVGGKMQGGEPAAHIADAEETMCVQQVSNTEGDRLAQHVKVHREEKATLDDQTIKAALQRWSLGGSRRGGRRRGSCGRLLCGARRLGTCGAGSTAAAAAVELAVVTSSLRWAVTAARVPAFWRGRAASRRRRGVS